MTTRPKLVKKKTLIVKESLCVVLLLVNAALSCDESRDASSCWSPVDCLSECTQYL